MAMCKYLKSTHLVAVAVGILISILGSACATTEKADLAEQDAGLTSNDHGEEKPKINYFRLVRGEILPSVDPLPAYIPFFLEIHGEDKILESYLKYKGWDFNRDGIVDMLEELSPEGVVISSSFDFNFNGTVDTTN